MVTGPINRRGAIKCGLAVAGAAISATMLPTAAVFAGSRRVGQWADQPMRWFQLAFTEDDPGHYDQAFWMDYLAEIHADGVCLSAGGGIAFYPTRVPFHGRARGLPANADPFGELVEACKKLDMRVLARIDPHAMNAQAAAAHPEWALTDAEGVVQRHASAPDLTLTCAYGPYNFEFMPKVIAEIADRYPVDGFFGNRWSGSGTCYCASCRTQYRNATGAEIPVNVDPSTPDGRRYAAWVEAQLLRVIDLWNATIQRHRPDAFFIPGTERRGLVDLDGRELGDRLPLAFGDRQARASDDSLWSTGPEAWGAGRYAKGLRAFMRDKPVGQIISVGVEEAYRWKDSVQAPAEIRIWAAGSIAQGARPWITKFNAKPFDHRWLGVVRDLYGWHHRNERYLRNTANLASVGLLVSSRTAPYLGGWKDRQAIEGHAKGFYQALLEARVPFDLIDDAFLDAATLKQFRTLVLANAAVLSERQCDQLRAFVAGGGRIVATHETSLYDENGNRRANFGLADLFGCTVAGEPEGPLRNAYLTLRHPHPALADLTDIPRMIGPVHHLPVTAHDTSEAAVTLVPPYPDLPMERVYTDRTTSDIPMVICRQAGKGRVAYLPMDIDRSFAELSHGDHLRLLGALVAWAHEAPQPLVVSGPGMVDVAIWRQSGSLTAHLVNLNNPMTMRGSYREAITTGPYEVTLRLPADAQVRTVRLLEADQPTEFRIEGDRLIATVPSIAIHEIVAVDLA